MWLLDYQGTLLCQPTLQEGSYAVRDFFVTSCSFYNSCQPISGLTCSDGSQCLMYQGNPYFGQIDLAAGTYAHVYSDNNCYSTPLTTYPAPDPDDYGIFNIWDIYQPASIWLHRYDTQQTVCDDSSGYAKIFFTCYQYSCPSGYTLKASPQTIYEVDQVPYTALCCDAPTTITSTTITSTTFSSTSSSTVSSSTASSITAAVREILETWTQLSAPNQSDSNVNESGVFAELSLSTEVGTVKVVALSPTTVTDSVPVSVGDENSSAGVEVPADLLAEISDGAPVLLSITLATEDFAAKFSNLPVAGDAEGTDAPIKLASKPLIFSLFGADGKPLDIGRKLQTPLVLSLEASDAAAVGAYWDEEAARWSTEGVQNLVAPERRLRQTSDFILAFESEQLAPVFAGILQALSCSTFAQIATETGLHRMTRTEWLTRASTLVVFCFVGLSLLALCAAHRQDWKAQQAIAKEDRNALHFHTQESLKEDVGAWCWCPSGGWLLSQCRRLVATLLKVGRLGPFVGETLVNHCIEAIHSHRSRVEKQSLRALLRHGSGKLRRSQTRDAMEILGRLGNSSHNLDIHGHGFSSVEEFVEGPWHMRVRLLLPAKHPWLTPLRFCAFVRASVRTALLILKLAGAGAVAALFFSSDAQLDDSDSGCRVADDFISQLVRKFWISVVSLFIGDAVILFLFLVQWRRTVRQESWTSRKMARQKCVWRLRLLCFWVLSLGYGGCCLFYCLLFLANVSAKDGLDWLEAMAFALVQDLVLVPVCVAVLLGLAATLALTCSRSVREGAENRWIEDSTFFSSCPADKFNGRGPGERGENANQDEAADIAIMDILQDAETIDDDLLENLASLGVLLNEASDELALGESSDSESFWGECVENHADFLRI
ncbi:HERC2 [Symbiodinium natans]|uniref:HERC2 protein n=1 Tax=Symbiodinium natans TaxID=878477 RepID=A0A812QB57_9DINO|nr:HERC2 [Symbiodinium natans]